MTGLFCVQCGEPIYGQAIRQETKGHVCLTCVLEALQAAKDKALELQDLNMDLRSDLVEAKAIIAELSSRLCLEAPSAVH